MKIRKLLKTLLAISAISLPVFAQAATTFTNVQGAVALMNPDGTETPVAENEQFSDSAILTIATGADGFTTVITAAGAINIEPNSIVRISGNSVTVIQGTVRAYGQGISVATGEATVVVNGESTIGSAEGKSVVNVIEGTASVTSSGTGDSVSVGAGNSAVVPAGSTPQSVDGPSTLPTPPATEVTQPVSQTNSVMLSDPIYQETDPEITVASPTGIR